MFTLREPGAEPYAAAREICAVQRVDFQLGKPPAVVLAGGTEQGGADLDVVVRCSHERSCPHARHIRDVVTAGQFELVVVDHRAGAQFPVGREVELSLLVLVAHVGKEEAGRVYGLVELREEKGVSAQLARAVPLRAPAVQAALVPARAKPELALAATVLVPVQAQLEHVVTLRIACRVQAQHVPLLLPDHVVIHAGELVEPVDVGDVALDAVTVEAFAKGLGDHVAEQLVGHSGVRFDAHLHDLGEYQARTLCEALGLAGIRKRGELRGERARRGIADGNRGLGLVEAGRRDAGGVEGRAHQHISRAHQFQLLLRVAAGHDVGELVNQREHVVEFFARRERRADVHHHETVNAHRLRHGDGDVHGDAAVHQQSPVDVHRCEDAGYGHARAHGERQIALRQHHGFARDDVGRDRAIGNGQLVEIADARSVRYQIVQHEVQVLPLYGAHRELQDAVLEAE